MAAKRKQARKRKATATVYTSPEAATALMKKREEPECFAVTRVYDASEAVVIRRDLGWPTPGEDWDPMLTVDFEPMPSELHPGDPKPQPADLENIRASGLRRVVASLVAAIDEAEKRGVIPRDLSDEEWQQRYEKARGAKG